MSVRAKFKVESVTHTADGSEVRLAPVTCGSKENDQFFKYTPYGECKIGTINKDASDQFIPGKEVYVDFTPCD